MDRGVVLLEDQLAGAIPPDEGKEEPLQHLLIFDRVHPRRRKSDLQLAELGECCPAHDAPSTKVASREDHGLLPQITPVVVVAIQTIEIELLLVGEDHLEHTD